MIDIVAGLGFEGYFVDEPTPLRDCYCPSCCRTFEAWYDSDLHAAPEAQREAFRQRCVTEYVKTIANYCKTHHPQLETMCCLMPDDQAMLDGLAQLDALDNLGTDIYWINNDTDVEQMVPIVKNFAEACAAPNKVHHEWLQCWNARKGRESSHLRAGQSPRARTARRALCLGVAPASRHQRDV